MKPITALVVAVVLCVSLALGGCASAPKDGPTADVFVSSAFAPPSEPIDSARALALSPAMKQFADTEMAAQVRHKGARAGLIDALYTRGSLQIRYDAEVTRTASQAFDARRGNCMSLVLMTAAFARYFDIPVQFNSVVVDDTWTRFNGLYFVTGHVNISLGRPMLAAPPSTHGDPSYLTVDFLHPDEVVRQRSRVIDESMVVAMYLNNRAAESLAAGKIDDAYWWAREAILTDSRWLAAYNTLAVLYRRKGMHAESVATLRVVLEREPGNTQALSNMILSLRDLGRTEEADLHASRLAQIQPVPPYQLFDEGVAAMRMGAYEKARQLFRRELARDAYAPEFHFWLGLANYGLGDLAGAGAEISKALENSATTRDRELYGAKLAWLNEVRDQRRRREPMP
ncbi:MAG: tetratricopeptide repeat protein, partial [Roseateles sp.]